MKGRTTHQSDVNQLVLDLLMSKLQPGTAVTDGMWDTAYEIVWAQLALETIDWKAEHINADVLARYSYDR